MSETYEPKYWNSEGRFQALYEELHKELVPSQGEAATPHGELLRIASRIYYDVYNNGGCNLKMQYYRDMRQTLLSYFGLLKLVADRLEVTNFEKRLRAFCAGKARDVSNDLVVDVIVSFANDQQQKVLVKT